MLSRVLGLGNLDCDAGAHQRGDHHKDDEEHEHHVRERRDVDRAFERRAAVGGPHGNTSKLW